MRAARELSGRLILMIGTSGRSLQDRVILSSDQTPTFRMKKWNECMRYISVGFSTAGNISVLSGIRFGVRQQPDLPECGVIVMGTIWYRASFEDALKGESGFCSSKRMRVGDRLLGEKSFLAPEGGVNLVLTVETCCSV